MKPPTKNYSEIPPFNQISSPVNQIDTDLSLQNYENLFDEEAEDSYDFEYDYNEEDEENDGDGENEDTNDDNTDEDDLNENDAYNFDEDEEELKEQLDMHSMILSKSEFNDDDLDEPLFTAEQVLDEIDSMMTMQEEEEEEICDEMTPDSGCYSTTCLSASLSTNFNSDLPIDLNGSYIKYINTFALQNTINSNLNNSTNTDESAEHQELAIISTDKTQLNALNVFQLNELIEQIENTTKELSETLVQVGLGLKPHLKLNNRK